MKCLCGTFEGGEQRCIARGGEDLQSSTCRSGYSSMQHARKITLDKPVCLCLIGDGKTFWFLQHHVVLDQRKSTHSLFVWSEW